MGNEGRWHPSGLCISIFFVKHKLFQKSITNLDPPMPKFGTKTNGFLLIHGSNTNIGFFFICGSKSNGNISTTKRNASNQIKRNNSKNKQQNHHVGHK
jgi:hypothetical protein